MMKRCLMIATTTLAIGALGAGGPAMAATTATTQATTTQANATQAQKLVRHAAQAVRDAQQNNKIAALMKQAKGVFVVPSYGEGSFLIGASGGNGVLTVRENGTWSDPAFYSTGSVSFGLQAGGKAGEIVMLLMSSKAVHDFETAKNLSLSGNAGLTVANFNANAHISTSNDDVVVWSNVQGAEGGVKVGGNGISRDQDLDRQYYNKNLTTTQILQGQANNPEADVLRNALRS